MVHPFLGVAWNMREVFPGTWSESPGCEVLFLRTAGVRPVSSAIILGISSCHRTSGHHLGDTAWARERHVTSRSAGVPFSAFPPVRRKDGLFWLDCWLCGDSQVAAFLAAYGMWLRREQSQGTPASDTPGIHKGQSPLRATHSHGEDAPYLCSTPPLPPTYTHTKNWETQPILWVREQMGVILAGCCSKSHRG
jgi:hypothetical protein